MSFVHHYALNVKLEAIEWVLSTYYTYRFRRDRAEIVRLMVTGYIDADASFDPKDFQSWVKSHLKRDLGIEVNEKFQTEMRRQAELYANGREQPRKKKATKKKAKTKKPSQEAGTKKRRRLFRKHTTLSLTPKELVLAGYYAWHTGKTPPEVVRAMMMGFINADPTFDAKDFQSWVKNGLQDSLTSTVDYEFELEMRRRADAYAKSRR